MPEPQKFPTARIALVGDRSPSVRSHTRIPGLLEALARRDQLILDAYWIPTPDAESPGALDGFDAVWLVPGSPYRSEEGALAAVRTAREQGIPFLGTCAGFQHALLEFARNVCGRSGAAHAENRPEAEDLLIVPLACSLVGHEGAVEVSPDRWRSACSGPSGPLSVTTVRTAPTRPVRTCCVRTECTSAASTRRATYASPSCRTTPSSSPPCSSRNSPATAGGPIRSSGHGPLRRPSGPPDGPGRRSVKCGRLGPEGPGRPPGVGRTLPPHPSGGPGLSPSAG